MGSTLSSSGMRLTSVIISYCMDYVIGAFLMSLPASMDTQPVQWSNGIISLPAHSPQTVDDILCLTPENVNLDCGMLGNAQESYCFVYKCAIFLQIFTKDFSPSMDPPCSGYYPKCDQQWHFPLLPADKDTSVEELSLLFISSIIYLYPGFVWCLSLLYEL